jgi:hypothetical protein
MATSHHFACVKPCIHTSNTPICPNPFVRQQSASFYCHFQCFIYSFKTIPLHLYIETTLCGRRYATTNKKKKFRFRNFFFLFRSSHNAFVASARRLLFVHFRCLIFCASLLSESFTIEWLSMYFIKEKKT